MAGFSVNDIPDLDGVTAVVTGSNSGIGFEAAKHLARSGATVVMACRNAEKAARAAERVEAASAKAKVEVQPLDLADLSSVREFAKNLATDHKRLDLLINNAGVMAVPHKKTADGFEMQLGTNHFGHFALTGLVLPLLLAAANSRVVTVSSLMHHSGRFDFDDLSGDRSYNRWTAYGRSKLANLLFAYELQRRFDAASVEAISVACHPGYAATNLQQMRADPAQFNLSRSVLMFTNRFFSQDAQGGALPTLLAATGGAVRGGEFYGPGRLQMWGPPIVSTSSRSSHSESLAQRLWEVSVECTGVNYSELG